MKFYREKDRVHEYWARPRFGNHSAELPRSRGAGTNILKNLVFVESSHHDSNPFQSSPIFPNLFSRVSICFFFKHELIAFIFCKDSSKNLSLSGKESVIITQW